MKMNTPLLLLKKVIDKIFAIVQKSCIRTLFVMLLPLFMSQLSVFASESIFECDFSQVLPRDKMSLSAGCSVKNGVLSIGAKTGKFYPRTATFPTEITAPFVLSFSMRITGISHPNDPLYGFTLFGSDGKAYQFCSKNGNSYIVLITENNRIINRKVFSSVKAVKVGDDTQMVPVELRFGTDIAEMKINGHSIGAIPLAFMPLEKINFFATNMELQIDDLKISLLAQKQDNYVQDAVFYAPFDNSAEAVIEGNKKIFPTVTGNSQLQFADGAIKQGVAIADYDLTYEVGELLGNAGAVMFWIKPTRKLALQTIYLQTADGKDRMVCRAQGYAFATNLYGLNGHDNHVFLRSNKYSFFNYAGDDLFHYAVTWDKTGAIRIFRNGKPYSPGLVWDPMIFFSADGNLSDVRKIVVSRRCNSLIDDLKIYRRHVSPEEVYAVYRQVSPVDVVVPDSVIQPTTDANVILKVAPGGYYTRPAHGEQPYIEAEGEFSLALYPYDKSDTAPLKTLKENVKTGSMPSILKFPVGKLPEGKYRLHWEFVNASGLRAQRSILIKVASLPDGEEATDQDIELGKVVFDKKFTSANDETIMHEGPLRSVDGKYLEAGNNNGNRFAVVIPNLQEFIQKPMIIEVTWPDDKQRMMGLYLFLESQGEAYRDRLQGGIQAGREIPNSGKMVKTRYLFYPQTPTVLFEARTLADNFPAAVAEVKLYEVQGDRLPKLKINYPEGMAHRRIGNCDEDQTLSTNMAKRDIVGLTDRILQYMDYTGQDAFHYPLLRYYYSFFPYPDGNDGADMYPYLPGGMGYVIDAMKRRNKEFTSIFNMITIPEVYYAPALGHDLEKTGMVVLDKNQQQLGSFQGMKGTPNISNPKVREDFVKYVEDFAEDLRKPGMKAVSFWLTMGWRSLSEGYDDYTVNKFSRETGIKVPASKRYEFLTSKEILPQWSKWRATQVFKLIKETRNALDKINPELDIYVMKRDNYDWDAYLDPMLKQLPKTYACDFRRPTNYRLDFHWKRPESNREEQMYDFNTVQELYKHKSNQSVSLFYIYYETYTKSLNQKYGCYFQSLDVKPHGRHFLKELAFNVAAGDVLELVMGGQPFGSFGRDAETREFARAFAALPHQSFNTVENSNHSIVVRYLNTKNGTYFYVVSNVWTNSKVELDWEEAAEYVDLSTNKKHNSKIIELKPYELRSFLIPDKKLAINGFKAVFPQELKQFYLKRIAVLEEAAKKFEAAVVV